MMRGSLRDRKEMTADERIEAVAERAAPDEKAAQDEQLAALRRCVDALPPMERQVVALYYLAGMEQSEIGDELALSQQVVSYRIKEALKRLRAGLTAAGFAAAVPLLDGPGLGAALGSGVPAPARVVARALSKLSGIPAGRLAEASARATRRAAGAKWGAAPVIAAVLAVAAVSAVAWSSRQRPPLAKAPSAAAPAGAKDEVVLEEQFDGEAVSAFFEKVFPEAQAGRLVAIQKSGNLSLIAGGPDVSIENRKPYPAAELESAVIPTKGRTLLVLFPNRSLLRDGPYSVGISFQNQDGVTLHSTEQFSSRDEADTIFKMDDVAGPLPAQLEKIRSVGMLFDSEGHVAMLNDEGKLTDFTRKPIRVDGIRVRLRASAGPGKGFVIWSFDRMRIVRLAQRPETGRIEIPEGFHYDPDWSPEKP